MKRLLALQRANCSTCSSPRRGKQFCEGGEGGRRSAERRPRASPSSGGTRRRNPEGTTTRRAVIPKPLLFRLFSQQLGLAADGPNGFGSRRKPNVLSITDHERRQRPGAVRPGTEAEPGAVPPPHGPRRRPLTRPSGHDGPFSRRRYYVLRPGACVSQYSAIGRRGRGRGTLPPQPSIAPAAHHYC